MPSEQPSITAFQWAYAGFVLLLVPAIVMGASGDARWIEGWVFSAWYALGSAYVLVWLNRHNPALLAERFRQTGAKDQSARDKIILPIMVGGFFSWMIVMPLDASRYHWTRWPWAVSLVGAVLLVGASHFLFRAFKDNTFLSPLVRVQTERAHRVIDTGVYAIVRHPMYLGATFLFVGAPLLLRSRYGVIVGFSIVALTVLRIFE